MKNILFLLIIIAFTSCSESDKKPKAYDSFIYSFSAQHLEYTIKFTNNDTVYFQRRFPKPVSDSYAILKDRDKDSLYALIERLDFTKYDSTYIQPDVTGQIAFKFFKIKNKKTEYIYVYGKTAPAVLYEMAASFNKITKQQDFSALDNAPRFEDIGHNTLPTRYLLKSNLY